MIYALTASVLIASISVLSALIFIRLNKSISQELFLPLAVGVFLSVVFFDLIPEALSTNETLGSISIAVGFMGFYLISRLLHTFHHHEKHPEKDCVDRSAGPVVLIGDSIHNLTDGIVVASAFLVSPITGIVVTIGIALHEIPQEIAEFAILLKAGYSKKRAILLNLLSSSSIIIGVILAFFFVEFFESILSILIGLAAGNLLFISASDLIPELNKMSMYGGKFWKVFLTALLGLIFMSLLLIYTH